jgi:hypothetical protein
MAIRNVAALRPGFSTLPLHETLDPGMMGSVVAWQRERECLISFVEPIQNNNVITVLQDTGINRMHILLESSEYHTSLSDKSHTQGQFVKVIWFAFDQSYCILLK